MIIFEYPHIKQAIRNALNDLKYKKRTSVISATGSGKSAIITTVIEEYKEKRILFAAPKVHMLNTIKEYLKNSSYDLEKDFFDLKFCTYAALHYKIKKGEIPDFDLFICDEIQAIGQKKQYQTIKKLFSYEDEKRYLGLTATPILQWEYEIIYTKKNPIKKRINMAELLYDNNISFFYPIEDALLDGLFPIPIYKEYFVLEKSPRETAIELLKEKKVKNIDENLINNLAAYLEKKSSLNAILQENINQKNTKIMYFCKNYKDLIKTEEILKKLFPSLSIYKTAYKLGKKNNQKNIEEFGNQDFVEGNSKILLSINQVMEGLHTDGQIQIILGKKTKSYRAFYQMYGRGFSLTNSIPVTVIDLGGNLRRIQSLSFLKFRNTVEKKEIQRKNNTSMSNKLKLGGNILELDSLLYMMSKRLFVSGKEKTDIYYDRMIKGFGKLKNPKEKFRDGTYLEDWYKEMLYIANTELNLYKQNKEYQITKDNMYIIETLAHIENFIQKREAQTEEKRREEYYKLAIYYKGILPKNETFRFLDGTYMQDWYHQQKKKVKNKLNEIDTQYLNEKDFELILWMNRLHIDLKNIWIEKTLSYITKEKNTDKYILWKKFSSEVEKNPSLLKSKKDCENLEEFHCIEEMYDNFETKTKEVANLNFPFATLNMDLLKKCIKEKGTKSKVYKKE